MNKKLICTAPLAIVAALGLYACGGNEVTKPDISSVKTIVVIYAENRSFDNLYGKFPGANGLQNVTAASAKQLDRDGSVMATLPPVWNGLTQTGVTPAVTQAMTANLPNSPFAIDDPNGFNVPFTQTTRDLWHRFYENQMQIDGGKNDKFAAWADSGGLVMGYYNLNADKLPLWKIAQQYTLADNFFMGAFGGSFLNHQWLVCACTPVYPNADASPAASSISAVNPDGVSLQVASNSPASAISGPPKFVKSGNLTPDFFAVNTMQPPYQPSGNKPASGGDTTLADPSNATTLPAQTQQNIGDLLNNAGVSWAWYGGAWGAALSASQSGTSGVIYGANMSAPNFQPHHQPFNYFAGYAPGTANRSAHLLDGGLAGSEFIKAIDAGTLPQVAFYKPQGNLNEHAGYTDVQSGDQHIADVIAHLQKSPQWNNMVVIVTYDENGGFWDHVAPPKGDRWGPGSRIPAIIVSPLAKKGFVDHTQYDTTSILRFITRRYALPTLPGLTARDKGLTANGNPSMGDLTNALDIVH
ncbi:acid phosphatase [Paraburkholderia sp. A1RI_3L]|uniref:acid phosphatase n=1 Tax=Paraburkholderia TaxID=1822464 RepID=UPI003B77ECB4